MPHGGGGPGVGPIGVVEHLKPYLPSHPVVDIARSEKAIPAVAAAPFGSPLILTIAYAYIKMMGAQGLKRATEVAILNANYVAKKLDKYFPIVYTGDNGWNAHEAILDVRQFKHELGITEIDVAKRLMDFGFHAPTVSFPVVGGLMVEPTESESKSELDRFIEAMKQIYNEIEAVRNGQFDKADNPLKNAPHPDFELVADNWEHKYSREQAAYPAEFVRENKFWLNVGRVDDAWGDRNVIPNVITKQQWEEKMRGK
jgi:glycine dehydrogenase